YEPIDGVLEAHWDGTNVVAVLSADERERPRKTERRAARAAERGRRRPEERGSGRVRAMVVGRFTAADLAALRDGKEPSFTADAEIEVEDLELSPIPMKSRMRGVLTGRATL